MTNLRNFLLTAAAMVLLAVAPANAGSLAVNLDFQVLDVQPGQTVTFSGTVTNLESGVLDLNGCELNLPTFSNDNCALFFALAPLSLNANETSYHFDMFTVTVDTLFAGPFGLQPPGILRVIGGLEAPGGGSTDNILVEAPFQVDVVPEPGTAALLALALPIAFALRRRAAQP